MTMHVQSLTLLHEKFPSSEHYPYDLPIFNNTDELEFSTPVTVFLGENGTGKSTLLEALARACDVHTWKFTETTRRYEINVHEKTLHRCLDISRPQGRVPGSYFGSEIFRDFKLLLDEWASSDPRQLKHFGGESLITKSHGQSMMAYFRSRYRIKGVYFLDEPETGLSPASQLQLLDIIDENSRAGHAQFFMATHSPLLMSCANARLFSFDHDAIMPVRYEDTDHYKLYKSFFDARA